MRVLDGGASAWTRAGMRSHRDAARRRRPNGRRARPRCSRRWSDVRDRLGKPDAVILDARTDGEYCGTTVRSARGGAIPGAVHLEWMRNLDADGAFKPAAELKAMYEQAGVTPDREVVTYCQGGYRAAHAYLALRLLGYPRLRNYSARGRSGATVELPIEHAEADRAPSHD